MRRCSRFASVRSRRQFSKKATSLLCSHQCALSSTSSRPHRLSIGRVSPIPARGFSSPTSSPSLSHSDLLASQESSLEPGRAVEYIWRGSRHIGVITQAPTIETPHLLEVVKGNGQSVWVRLSSLLFVFPASLTSSAASVEDDPVLRSIRAKEAASSVDLDKFQQRALALLDEQLASKAKRLYNAVAERATFTVHCALQECKERGFISPSPAADANDSLHTYAVLCLLVTRHDLFSRLSSFHFRCRDEDSARLAHAERSFFDDRKRRAPIISQLYQRLLVKLYPQKALSSAAGDFTTMDADRQRAAKLGWTARTPRGRGRNRSSPRTWPDDHRLNNLSSAKHYSDLELALSAIRRYALAAFDLDTTDFNVFREIIRPFGYNRPFGAHQLLIDLGYSLGNLHAAKLALDTDLMQAVESLLPISAPAVVGAAIAKDDDETVGPDLDRDQRIDFDPNLRAYAIDSIETTDVDDAVSLEKRHGGKELWLHVHIADPTSFSGAADIGSDVEKLAARRASTLYLPEHIAFMLPERLRLAFSLDRGRGHLEAAACSASSSSSSSTVPVRTLTISVRLSPETGEIIDQELAVMRVPRVIRLTYDEVDDALQRNQFSRSFSEAKVDFEEIQQLLKLASLRRRYRVKRGAIALLQRDLEVKVAGGQRNGSVLRVGTKEEGPSALLVSEMMIMSAEAVARFATAQSVPIAFRRQLAPTNYDEEGSEVAALVNILHEDDLQNYTRVTSDGVSTQMLPLAQSESMLNVSSSRARRRAVQEFRLLRSMQSAVTSPDPGAHWALSLDNYSRFSSPLRRYADFLTHAQLKTLWRGGERRSTSQLQETLGQFDVLAALNRRVQRRSALFWLARWLQDESTVSFSSERVCEGLVLDANLVGSRALVLLSEYGGARGWFPLQQLHFVHAGEEDLGESGIIGGLVQVETKQIVKALKTVAGPMQ